MEEFINNKKKVLKIDNPLNIFANILSLGASANSEQRTEKWNSLNTLMIINNHRRIDQLESQLELEQARVRYLEDFSGQLSVKVLGLEGSMDKVKKELKSQKKNILTILSLVKFISKHQSSKNSSSLGIIKRLGASVIQNTVIYGIVHLLMKIALLDGLIDNLLGIMRLGNILSRKTMEKSRFMAKLLLSITLFVILREKIKFLLEKLRNSISILAMN